MKHLNTASHFILTQVLGDVRQLLEFQLTDEKQSLTMIPKRSGTKLELESRPHDCEAFVLSTTPYLNKMHILFMIVFFKLEKYLGSLMCQILDD